jgi:hypothetical protein
MGGSVHNRSYLLISPVNLSRESRSRFQSPILGNVAVEGSRRDLGNAGIFFRLY